MRKQRRNPLILSSLAILEFFGSFDGCCATNFFGERLIRHLMNSGGPCHTTFSFHKPTEEDLEYLFSSFSSSNNMEFNHEFVGVTNPSINTSTREEEEVTHLTNCATAVASAKSNPKILRQSSTSTEDTNVWIPDYFTINSSKGRRRDHPPNPPWRTIRIRRTVGYGQECYETLRDVILQWEGTIVAPKETADKKKRKESWASIRLLNYLPPMEHPLHFRNSRDDRVMQTSFGNNDHHPPNANVNTCYQIGGNLKKLVTISKSPGGIWTWNPCQVIYDLVDERYTDKRNHHGLTYTATAYATLKGHLLAGEERLCVAIHDDSKVEVEVLSYSRATNSVLGKAIFPFVRGMQQRFFSDQITALEQIAKQQRHSNPTKQKQILLFPEARFAFEPTSNPTTVSTSLISMPQDITKHNAI